MAPILHSCKLDHASPGAIDPLPKEISVDGELQGYLHALTRRLRLDANTNGEIVRELQDHLEDKVQELEEEGLTHREALSLAVRDLGRRT